MIRSPKSLLLCTTFFITYLCTAQYTETINSNRPGQSQGAFSVGTKVLQGETGFDFGNATHSLLQTDTDVYGYNLNVRYGILFEALELNGGLRYQVDNVQFLTGVSSNDPNNGFESLNIGAKYLAYDPYKRAKEEVNLYSYRANHRFKWKTLIPAVSVSVNANFDFTATNQISYSPSSFGVRDDGVSPTAALITQNNWGRWVLVNNFIFDRIGTNFSSKIWITTMTHSVTSKFAVFGEFQLFSGDLYADQVFRGGVAYLFTKNFQADASYLANLKDTPSRWNVSTGVSFRFDLHEKDEVIEDEMSSEDKKK